MTGSLTRAFEADQRYYGGSIGIVVANDDPRGEGRVRLRFPWFSEDMESDWVRVAQPYAGGGFGFYWVPEVETEVIVSFVQGDIRFPIVIGSLYNGQDKPAVARNGRDPKVIRTKAGHRILIEDQAGQEKIEIVDAEGNSITIETTTNTITISALGNIAIKATGKLTMSGQGGVEISSSGAVTVRGTTIGLN
jgi:phage baseplate assembly protein V